MSIDFSAKSIGQLEALIQNYRRESKTDSDIYLDAMRELELRRTKGLDLQKTLDLVATAASERKFVSYKQIATTNGCMWEKVHFQVGDHLGRLCEYAHRKGMPLLSSIVVNIDGIESGEMKPESRQGFIDAAKSLGFLVADDEEFLRNEQEKVFKFFAKTVFV